MYCVGNMAWRRVLWGYVLVCSFRMVVALYCIVRVVDVVVGIFGGIVGSGRGYLYR